MKRLTLKVIDFDSVVQNTKSSKSIILMSAFSNILLQSRSSEATNIGYRFSSRAVFGWMLFELNSDCGDLGRGQMFSASVPKSPPPEKTKSTIVFYLRLKSQIEYYGAFCFVCLAQLLFSKLETSWIQLNARTHCRSKCSTSNVLSLSCSWFCLNDGIY